jgi:hypothetical protein
VLTVALIMLSASLRLWPHGHGSAGASVVRVLGLTLAVLAFVVASVSLSRYFRREGPR